MSLVNARASFNHLVAGIADAGVPVLFEPHQAWLKTCYRIEWLDAEVPRGFNEAARNVRVHVQGPGTLDQETRIERLVAGLKLPANEAGLAVHPLYDYKTDPQAPPVVGSFRVERSAAGLKVVDPTIADPTLRHLILSLVIVYPRSR